MKTNVFCVIAFVALVNGIDGIHGQPTISKTLRRTRSIEDLKICVPGETKKEDCNHCFCTEDGFRWACTKKGCFTEIEMNTDGTTDQLGQNNPSRRAVRDASFTCVPNSMFKIDCNWCSCTADGRTAACTLMGCISKPYYPFYPDLNPGLLSEQ